MQNLIQETQKKIEEFALGIVLLGAPFWLNCNGEK